MIRRRLFITRILLPALCLAAWAAIARSETLPLDSSWHFLRADDPRASAPDFADDSWEDVTLPHTARIEALVAGSQARQWQGVCWYRNSFFLPENTRGKSILLRFDGAMNATRIWINGKPAGNFQGGYLPYIIDISRAAIPGRTNVVALRLDNRDNPVTGPKPLADLDFNLYGGLYRSASLIIKDPLHVTDPLLADRPGGGGVFVTFPSVSEQEATLRIQTHVENSGTDPRRFIVRTTLLDSHGNPVASEALPPAELPAGTNREFVQTLRLSRPQLWSPDSPALYRLRTELQEPGPATVIDTDTQRIGIRRIEIDAAGFRINGRKMFLRGVNRHQEYPYVGNAVPANAQYRDALKIKQAGFDYIRLSHYPQSPDFLDACDELGLVVMDSILGWQYYNSDPAFAELKLRECRQLVRRDRNHPCVVLWEVSLNETPMPREFIARANSAAHEEYPGDQCYTAGWKDGFDVLIQARQHGGCHSITNRPCLVSEYGDWEYYAQNAGFDQGRWKDLQPAERSSRQLRGDGETRLLQQALNFQEAHNDDLGTTAFADGLWVMFDYNRGYAPDLETSGAMDIFRLPKFGYWFFRSQRDPGEAVAGRPAGAGVFIANYWTPDSPLDVRVFSNCEEVALYLNDRLIERRRPDTNRWSTRLRHPPFTFNVGRFEPGTLRAVGYIAGSEVARQDRRTPQPPSALALRFDLSGRAMSPDSKDALFCHADVVDANGTVATADNLAVFFATPAGGGGRLIGHNPIQSEAGIASILVESDGSRAMQPVYALAFSRDEAGTRLLAAGATPAGLPVPAPEIRYTLDGSEPTLASPLYAGPLTNASRLRAAIVVNGRIIGKTDSTTPAYSIANPSVLTAQSAAR
ncbi:MAG: glycoside hydrolase family 2 TIM barrel-domain containing protein [Verrucomicrobiota bacterium]